jgi:hypothetical protein
MAAVEKICFRFGADNAPLEGICTKLDHKHTRM